MAHVEHAVRNIRLGRAIGEIGQRGRVVGLAPYAAQMQEFAAGDLGESRDQLLVRGVELVGVAGQGADAIICSNQRHCTTAAS